jgi:threonine/homoserine/homoserine lactone efflux protein
MREKHSKSIWNSVTSLNNAKEIGSIIYSKDYRMDKDFIQSAIGNGVVLGEFYLALVGFALGLSLAAPPGPVNAVIMNESSKSKLHGSSVGAGAMTADFIFLVILYFGRVVIPSWAFKYLYVVGAFVMIYLALSVIRSKMPAKTPAGNYFVGLTMGISNPFQIIWWVTVGLFLIERLSILSVIGFFLGLLSWIILFPYAMNKVGRRYSPLLRVFSFVVLIVFAVIMLFYGVKSFL